MPNRDYFRTTLTIPADILTLLLGIEAHNWSTIHDYKPTYNQKEGEDCFVLVLNSNNEICVRKMKWGIEYWNGTEQMTQERAAAETIVKGSTKAAGLLKNNRGLLLLDGFFTSNNTSPQKKNINELPRIFYAYSPAKDPLLFAPCVYKVSMINQVPHYRFTPISSKRPPDALKGVASKTIALIRRNNILNYLSQQNFETVKSIISNAHNYSGRLVYHRVSDFVYSKELNLPHCIQRRELVDDSSFDIDPTVQETQDMEVINLKNNDNFENQKKSPILNESPVPEYLKKSKQKNNFSQNSQSSQSSQMYSTPQGSQSSQKILPSSQNSQRSFVNNPQTFSSSSSKSKFSKENIEKKFNTYSSSIQNRNSQKILPSSQNSQSYSTPQGSQSSQSSQMYSTPQGSQSSQSSFVNNSQTMSTPQQNSQMFQNSQVPLELQFSQDSQNYEDSVLPLSQNTVKKAIPSFSLTSGHNNEKINSENKRKFESINNQNEIEKNKNRKLNNNDNNSSNSKIKKVQFQYPTKVRVNKNIVPSPPKILPNKQDTEIPFYLRN